MERGTKSDEGAFSLLELLLAMSLIAVLTAAGLAAYSSIAQATALTEAAQQVSDLLAEGRANATAQNTTVEVRFYDLPGSTDPTPGYRALQLHWLKADGTKPAVQALLFLPALVVIDGTAAHSTLIGANNIATGTDPADPYLNSQTRVFHFLADGSTDLASGGSWFVTVRAATQNNPANFPANWASVAVDPVTGRAQVYRP
jgi:uncharacterized protein (TIGR02596 family)